MLQPGNVQDAAFGVHLVEFQPAGFRDAQAMPEHQEQQATVAVIPARVSAFASVYHFVESSSCAMPRKPA
jgi:hypothetical protein